MSRDLGIESVSAKPFYFLSYNSQDALRVKGYAQALAAEGVRLWYDKGIKTDEPWGEMIAAHIRNSEAVVMFLTRGIFRKETSFVRNEYKVARKYSKRVILVLLDQIAGRDVPVRYDFWWSEITDRQCIRAWEFSNPVHCAAQIAQDLGVTAPPPVIERIEYDDGVYEGTVVNGVPHGRGKRTWANGRVYEGDFASGIPNGRGKKIWGDGAVYEGDWVDDKRYGKGKYTTANCIVYEGDWEDNKPHGWGILISPYGKVLLKGQWKDGKYIG